MPRQVSLDAIKRSGLNLSILKRPCIKRSFDSLQILTNVLQAEFGWMGSAIHIPNLQLINAISIFHRQDARTLREAFFHLLLTPVKYALAFNVKEGRQVRRTSALSTIRRTPV